MMSTSWPDGDAEGSIPGRGRIVNKAMKTNGGELQAVCRSTVPEAEKYRPGEVTGGSEQKEARPHLNLECVETALKQVLIVSAEAKGKET